MSNKIRSAMQKVIDVKAIIKKSGLGIEETADLLFPNHKSPYSALRRIMDGPGELNAEEIVRFSQITGVEVGLLFNPDIWKVSSAIENGRQLLRMRSDSYIAELDMEALVTTVMPINGKDFKSFTVTESMPLRMYLSKLTEFVNN